MTNLDILPSSERMRRRKRLRSPEEYEESRERAKEQMEKVTEDQEQNKKTSEVMLFLELGEVNVREIFEKLSLDDITSSQKGYDAKQWDDMQQAFADGKYNLTVRQNDQGNPRIDADVELPEGNVQEKIPLRVSFQEAIATAALTHTPPDAIKEWKVCEKCHRGVMIPAMIAERKVLRCTECGYIADHRRASDTE